jgi:hypothetical protein
MGKRKVVLLQTSLTATILEQTQSQLKVLFDSFVRILSTVSVEIHRESSRPTTPTNSMFPLVNKSKITEQIPVSARRRSNVPNVEVSQTPNQTSNLLLGRRRQALIQHSAIRCVTRLFATQLFAIE